LNSFLFNQNYNFKGEWWHSFDPFVRFAGELEYVPDDDKVELTIWGESDLKDMDFYNES
jgi:hypothetical protein